MMNIFSSFNPLNYLFLSNLLLNIFLSMLFWKMLVQDKMKKFSTNMENFVTMDFNKINNSIFSISTLISLFMFNCFLNLLNLLPFSFCLNSQLNSFLFFCLIMWMSCVMYSLLYYYKNFFSHLTPMGCPMVLSPLMVVIELISLIIRPITLSVRMAANMLAGHLLIHLLTDFSLYLMNFSMFSFLPMIILLMILNLLEIGVSVVQPYILCVLINMYLCESN